MPHDQKVILRAMVSSSPPAGHDSRMRGKPPLRWTRVPVEVVVVDSPDPKAAGPIQISPESWERLRADKHINFQSADPSSDPEMAGIKAALLAAEAKAAGLEAQLAEVSEERAEDGRRREAHDEQVSAKLSAYEVEIGALRAKLSEKVAKGARVAG